SGRAQRPPLGCTGKGQKTIELRCWDAQRERKNASATLEAKPIYPGVAGHHRDRMAFGVEQVQERGSEAGPTIVSGEAPLTTACRWTTDGDPAKDSPAPLSGLR